MPPLRTLCEVCRQTAPRSLWRSSLAARARPLSAHEYRIDEANLRGFLGAYRAGSIERAADPSFSLEDVVVGLLSPHAPAEARIFKLVLRILQSGRLSPATLIFRAKRERALGTLYWLLQQVPPEEKNESVQGLLAMLARPPRGYRPLFYGYDPQRLVRRPARKEDLWRKQRN